MTTSPRHRIGAAISVAALVATLCACGSGSESSTSTTNASSPTAPTTAASSDGALVQTGPLPDLTVTPAAASAVGAANARAGWSTLSEWILDTGYDADLVRTIHPTAAQLAPVTALMTARCAAALQADVASETQTAIGSIEAITAVGVTAPDATPIDGDDLVTDRAITTATADVSSDGALTIAATSTADIHYAATADPTRHTHSTFARHTTYTLVQQDGRWLVGNWQGTYTTSDPVPD